MNNKQNNKSSKSLKIKPHEVKLKKNDISKPKISIKEADKLVSNRLRKLRATLKMQNELADKDGVTHTSTEKSILTENIISVKMDDSRNIIVRLHDHNSCIVKKRVIERDSEEYNYYLNKVIPAKPKFGRLITTLLVASVSLLCLAYYLA